MVNGKSENLYTRIFQELSDLILKQYKLTISTKFIITDFEKAVINSTRAVFNLKNKACFFHLSQNIWKKVQNEKMVSEYITNSEFQKLVKSLVALAFLTPAKIPILFNIREPILELACFPYLNILKNVYLRES